MTPEPPKPESPTPAGDTHERIDAAALGARDVYRLMTDLVAPRPIAWIASVNEQGHHNLAPFSYFQAVCSAPPMVVVSFAWGSDGKPKDTLSNILATRQFTISHVGRPLVEAMNLTSGAVPPEVSEWELAHEQGWPVRAAASARVGAPWVADAKAAFECKLVQATPLGRTRKGTPSSTLVLAEVLCFWVASGLLRRDPNGHLLPVNPAQLASVGRLGGIAYTETGAVFEIPRPTDRTS